MGNGHENTDYAGRGAVGDADDGGTGAGAGVHHADVHDQREDLGVHGLPRHDDLSLEMTPVRIFGNAAYLAALQEEMDRTGLDKDEAEVELLNRIVTNLRLKDELHHADIFRQLKEHWGFTRSAYWIRMQRIRKKYACP